MMSWNVFGNLGGKILYPASLIIIARMLTPEDYGVFIICIFMFSLYTIVKDLGLTDSIIVSQQGGNLIGIQFSVQLIIAVLFYLIVLFSAEPIAQFFDNPKLRQALPVFMVAVLLSAYIDPLITKCLKAQDFKLIAIRNILMPLIMGVVGITLAHSGIGVEALIYSFVAGHLSIALLFFIREGMVHLHFDLRTIKNLMGLGRHLLFQRMLGFVVNESDVAIIGKYVGPGSLGIYRISHQIALLAPQAFFPHISQVLFTEFAKEDRNNETIAENYRNYSWATGGVLLAYSVTMYFAAPLVVPLVLGESWQGAASIIPILSHMTVTGNMTLLNLEISKAYGFARRYSFYAIARAIVTVVALYFAVAYGITVVAIVALFLTLLFTTINEFIFYHSQSFISLDWGKVMLYVLALGWAIYISLDALL